MSTPVELPYGSTTLSFPLPSGWTVEQVRVPPPPPARPLDEAARAALDAPVAGPRLRDLARPGMSVTVAFTDATRPCPDHVLLPLLVEELESAGVRRDDITVLMALGMHRHPTEEEIRTKVGPLWGSIRVEDAQGAETEKYDDLGWLSPDDGKPYPEPVPVLLHRRITRADLVVATGIVEPHQYAGFSGARKTVGIGCVGRETIGVLHGIAFLEDPGTRLGRLEDNPVHRAVEAIARRGRLAFVLNVAHDGAGRLVEAAAGEPGPVLAHLVDRLAPFTWVPVGTEPFDAVFAGVGAPKDANFYQASRAFTYLVLSSRPVLREGGWVVLPAHCEEGAGRGPGEQEFLSHMKQGRTPTEVLAGLRRTGFGAGGQRAFVLSQALQRNHLLVVGAVLSEEVQACLAETVPDPTEAMRRMRERLPGRARVLVVPHAIATLPVPEPEGE